MHLNVMLALQLMCCVFRFRRRNVMADYYIQLHSYVMSYHVMLCSASMYMIHIDTLCHYVCYVHVMCMLFVCNMMLTLQRRELSRKTKSPTSSERPLRRGHGRRAQRCTLDVRQGRQGTDGTRGSDGSDAPRNGPKDTDLTTV